MKSKQKFLTFIILICIILTFRFVFIPNQNSLNALTTACVPPNDEDTVYSFLLEKSKTVKKDSLSRAILRPFTNLESDFRFNCNVDGTYSLYTLHGNPFAGGVYQTNYHFFVRDGKICILNSLLVR